MACKPFLFDSCRPVQYDIDRATTTPQALQLDASVSVDDDDIDIEFDFRWYCEDGAGGTCLTRTGGHLELSSFVGEAVLFLPAGSLPAGELREIPSQGSEAEL